MFIFLHVCEYTWPLNTSWSALPLPRYPFISSVRLAIDSRSQSHTECLASVPGDEHGPESEKEKTEPVHIASTARTYASASQAPPEVALTFRVLASISLIHHHFFYLFLHGHVSPCSLNRWGEDEAVTSIASMAFCVLFVCQERGSHLTKQTPRNLKEIG
ncbi:hypothetical protein N657DRAFT_85601 [Parathielavia appendiculata]|uniref:Uncharacterized protein n=1 Tax=Parathielavia appendiculata TaxID=2587402 RepID=A0AAN6Z9I0_9PEZI|nr:hypothetical protein N657DRAFT_85601 [Parathielavia appendiculata]